MCARRLSVSLALLLTALPAAATEDFIDGKLWRLKAGLICPSDKIVHIPAPDTMLGHIRRTHGEQVVVSTRTVPMVKSLGFGIDVRPKGPRIFDPVTVTITHPPYKGTDITTESWQAAIRPGRSNLNYFVFELDEEMVPGTWTFSLTYEDRMLLQSSFEVVQPEDYPNVKGLCDGELISALPTIRKTF